jgi:hypothetical protein
MVTDRRNSNRQSASRVREQVSNQIYKTNVARVEAQQQQSLERFEKEQETLKYLEDYVVQRSISI